MKLRSLLRKQNRDTLVSLVQHRDIPLENIEECSDGDLVDAINTALKKDDQVKYLLQSLTPTHRRLFDYVAIYGGEVREPKVIEVLFEGNRDHYIEVMRTLSAYALTFRDEVNFTSPESRWCWIPEQYLKYILVPRFAVKRLHHLLQQSSLGQLKSIAYDGLKLPPKQNTQDELLDAITERLLDPEHLKKHINALPYPKKVFIKLLVDWNGEADIEDVRQGFAKVEGLDVRQFNDVLDDLLWREHFLFLEDVGHRNLKRKEHARVVSVPIEVYVLLKSSFSVKDLTPIGIFRFLLTRDSAGSALEEPGFNIVRDITTFLGFIANTEPQVLKKGGLRKNIFEHVCQLMDQELPREYLEFLIIFCEQTGLIRDHEGFWLVSSKAAERLSDAWGLLCQLITFWSDNPKWATYSDAANRPAKISTSPSDEVLDQNRSFLSHLLYFVPRSDAFDIDIFYEFIFDKASLLPNAVTSSNAMYNSFSSGLGSLTQEDLAKVFSGILRWLGAVKVGTAPDGRAVAQLTELGNSLLGFRDLPRSFRDQFKTVESFSFEDGTCIVAPENLHPELLLFLCRFSRLSRSNNALHFRMDKDSLRFGLDRGALPNEIRNFIERHSEVGIPPEMEALLKECGARHGDVEVGLAGGYVKVNDEATLHELLNFKPIREFLIDERLGNLALLEDGTDMERFLKELRKKGFVPASLVKKARRKEDGVVRFSLTSREVEFLDELVRLMRTLSHSLSLDLNNEELDRLEDQISTLLTEETPDKNKFHDLFLERFADYIDKHRFTEHSGSDKNGSDGSHSYDGPNPAEDAAQIAQLLRFAATRKIRTRIYYALSEELDNLLIDTVVPNTVEEKNLVAFCSASKTSRNFLLSRITRAELLGNGSSV